MDPTIALYVHWPFCLSKCPYCDFNSHAAAGIDQAAWREALVRDLGFEAAAPPGRSLASVFFGGGTPSLMAPATVAAVLDAAARHWNMAPDAEITLEANPTSIEAARFRDFRAAGVNRVSIGAQSLDDDALRALGRRHSAAEAVAALGLAGRVFDRVSFDLIYARPGQTAAAWRAELARAIPLARGHLSAYQLTIEPGTAFHRRGVAAADEDLGGDLYDLTVEALAAAGLPAYEISNHAAPGMECRHNLVYWRGGDYAGIGPGAHGRRTDGRGVTHATRRLRDPGHWLEAVATRGHGLEADDPLSPAERVEELVLTGLRLTAGIGRATFAARAGMSLEAALDPARVARLTAGGFLIADDAGLRATPAGIRRLDAVLGALLG